MILRSSSSVIAIRDLEIINLLRGYGTPTTFAKSPASLYSPQNLKIKPTPEPYLLANVLQMEYLKKKDLKNILLWNWNTPEISQDDLSPQALCATECKYFETPLTVHRHYTARGSSQISHSESIW